MKICKVDGFAMIVFDVHMYLQISDVTKETQYPIFDV